MLRLLALTGVFLVALVGAGSAQALSETKSTLLRSALADTNPNITKAQLRTLIADIDAQGLQQSSNPNVRTGITRMQMQAGRIASLRALTAISGVAAGSVVVWKIADALGLGGYVYKKVSGTAYGGSLGSATGLKWQCLGSSPCHTLSNGATTLNTGWYWKSDQWTEPYLDAQAGGVGTTTLTAPGPCASLGGIAAETTCLAGIDFAGSFVSWQTGGSAPYKHVFLRSDRQMREAVTITPSDAAEYASPPAGAVAVEAGTNDTTTPTDLELEAALDEIDPNPGTPGTTLEEETAEAILDELQPGWAQGILLQPLPNETYTTYITRLQDAGWVGTATTTVVAAVEPGYGPEAVVRVIATPSGGTTTVYDPLNWPSPAPTIDIDSDITIRYNPSSAPEAPTTQTPTTITVPPTTIPGTPALDFTPLTDIDWGCKFPYGFLCYAVDFSEQFNVAADAPTFTFDMEMDVALGSFDLGTYTVDLEVMDAWMDLWRDILSVVLVVGAIYFLATRLLGFKAGGDPGAAMDDVL